jgi:hypothetical protein
VWFAKFVPNPVPESYARERVTLLKIAIVRQIKESPDLQKQRNIENPKKVRHGCNGILRGGDSIRPPGS